MSEGLGTSLRASWLQNNSSSSISSSSNLFILQPFFLSYRLKRKSCTNIITSNLNLQNKPFSSGCSTTAVKKNRRIFFDRGFRFHGRRMKLRRQSMSIRLFCLSPALWPSNKSMIDYMQSKNIKWKILTHTTLEVWRKHRYLQGFSKLTNISF